MMRAPIRSTLLLALVVILVGAQASAQTAATGALSGLVTDPSGAVVSGARISVVNEATGAAVTAVSSSNGRYLVPLLSPGSYRVDVSKQSFKVSTYPNIVVAVTETRTLNLGLQVGTVTESVQVDSSTEQLQTESSGLGHVTNSQMVENLPLVTRNYTQIVGLSPGVAADVTNAGSLGRGGGSDGGEPFVANGGSSMDNNFQMNGVEINDVQHSGFLSGGVAVPNPDTIQEFKVQTGQFDAAFGRNAGANVDVVTKGGSNEYHGTLFEFFRNEKLNANEYFRKLNDQPRQILRQNQFGFTFGGPIRKDKLFFFTSYQGTRQLNGVDVNCSSTISTPPLTNDRSAAALGALFAGQTGLFGGSAILPDGSNIAPQALALLQRKLPDGSFLIPTPQRIDPTTGLGTNAFSIPCRFTEEQFMTNADWQQSGKSKFAGRFFFANSHEDRSLPPNTFGAATAPGFPLTGVTHFRNFSLTHTYLFSNALLNQAEIAFHRQFTTADQNEAFHYSDIGVNAPPFDNAIPAIILFNQFTLGGNGQGLQIAQNFLNFQDDLVWTHGRHSLHVGGGFNRGQENFTKFHFFAGLGFLSFPDFLLGQDGATNGTGISNVFLSLDLPGLFDRYFRIWEYNTYAQDDIKVTSRLTVNLGLRFEHLGGLGDELGRNGSFDMARADPNPPPSGSLAGFVVPDNFRGTVPTGVTRLDNDLGYRGDGQNTWNPRIGFAWQMPPSRQVVLRGGYGVYHQRVTGQPLIQLLLNQPFGLLRELQATENAAATFANPFPPGTPVFPSFTPYVPDPTTPLSGTTFAQNFRPPIFQRYSLNVQTALARDLVLEVGYVGTRGTHLVRQRAINQALSASPSNPIRGQTDNTVANIPLRAPLLGWTTNNLLQTETEGSSRYNSLTTSLSKRFSHGLQLLASYTFARDLSDEYFSATGSNGGVIQGDQNNAHAGYGPDNFIREHRFVVSYVYELPFFRQQHSVLGRVLGGWRVAGVTVLQSGHRLGVVSTNAFNAFGISGFGGDFAQLGPCTLSQVNTSGSVTDRLNKYINTSCFPVDASGLGVFPVIGADGVATGFGNTRPGIVHGPDQRNTDLSLIKQFVLPWRNDRSNLEFRAEFFNAFNTPQFSDPDNEQDSPTFGQVLSTAVAPRIIQFALKLNF